MIRNCSEWRGRQRRRTTTRPVPQEYTLDSPPAWGNGSGGEIHMLGAWVSKTIYGSPEQKIARNLASLSFPSRSEWRGRQRRRNTRVCNLLP